MSITKPPIAGILYQGTDPISNTNPVPVSLATGSPSTTIGTIAGRTANPSVTPTVTASSAYTANTVVGGLLTFANSVDTAGSGLLQSIVINSKSVQTAGFKLAVFNANPTASTFTDNVAPSINSADVNKLIGIYDLSGTYSSALGTHTIYQYDSIGKLFAIPSGTALYGALLTTGTPTFSSNTDVTVALSIIKD